ncbi:YraN family protein [Nostoc sp. UCD121]|uniref:YraN family protein n=1 Tax=unclassified Nostoc TaxID=2593658 RepID=UPI0016272A2B|nr:MULTISPECIES: YraN family protein [unclassified Nostoc]MBC1221977.1 YraN family protein [Nostoc sp. UCD120]MBC1276365.1 YraN family protein [Nostoc sp. UCD121]MBC1293685.1 YraN family protein [Nostoc sp. UCD122]
MTNLPPSHYPDIGHLGEDLVAQWLQSTGWIILHRRFSSRYGEIDIIAQYDGQTGEKLLTQQSLLAFVEVKTRSSGSWDAGGRSAITPQKQAKILRTAGIFLAQYPEKADYACRFDVAIVYCQRISKNQTAVIATQEALATSSAAEYKFKLQEYILAAFDSSIDNG